jgi:Emfourin
MQVRVERSGGFAGLRQTHDVDSSQLSPEEGQELNHLVESARFFDLPADVRAASPGADRFQYKLTVKAGPREHTVAVDDAAMPATLRPLLNFAAAKAIKS